MANTQEQERQSRAGCVQLRRARSTGTLVGIYEATAQGLDPGDNGETAWYTICEDHGTAIGHENVTRARHFASAPEVWCEECS